ncbi:MAG: hypothetical protein JSW41_04865 [Candidatus Aenigmatarchaeota archaeon]|nr:MAG: hypothetical protein JSW41_04865 [Candidatus Aenigmarchaeota archaeon]
MTRQIIIDIINIIQTHDDTITHSKKGVVIEYVRKDTLLEELRKYREEKEE